MADEEDSLIEKIRQGNDDALSTLFSLYEPRLRRMITFRLDNRLKRRVDPDDLLQEAWIAIAQRVEHFRKQPEAASCYVWMRLVTDQVMMDVYRRHLSTQARDAGREFSLDHIRGNNAASHSIANFFLDAKTSPTQAVARAEAAEQIQQAVAEMDATDQEVLALRHFEELSNAEVSEVLGITGSAASTRYIRALKKLHETLQRFPDLMPQ